SSDGSVASSRASTSAIFQPILVIRYTRGPVNGRLRSIRPVFSSSRYGSRLESSTGICPCRSTFRRNRARAASERVVIALPPWLEVVYPGSRRRDRAAPILSTAGFPEDMGHKAAATAVRRGGHPRHQPLNRAVPPAADANRL